MKLILSREEMDSVRQTVSNLNSKGAANIYNCIFGNAHIRELDISVNGDEITVDIPEAHSRMFFTVLKKHTRIIGSLIASGFNVGTLLRWKHVLSNFGHDVQSVFKYR